MVKPLSVWSSTRARFQHDEALIFKQAYPAYVTKSLRTALRIGVFADLAVVAENLFTLPAEQLAGAEVAATLVGGEMVHGALE